MLCKFCNAVEVTRYKTCLHCRLLTEEVRKSGHALKSHVKKEWKEGEKQCNRCRIRPAYKGRKSCRPCLVYFASREIYKTTRSKYLTDLTLYPVTATHFLRSSYR